jgi:hypothetical protein
MLAVATQWGSNWRLAWWLIFQNNVCGALIGLTPTIHTFQTMAGWRNACRPKLRQFQPEALQRLMVTNPQALYRF